MRKRAKRINWREGLSWRSTSKGDAGDREERCDKWILHTSDPLSSHSRAARPLDQLIENKKTELEVKKRIQKALEWIVACPRCESTRRSLPAVMTLTVRVKAVFGFRELPMRNLTTPHSFCIV